MPRAKSLDNYPESFFKLMERAASGPVRIETGSESAAKNLRSELYVFRSVLRANPKVKPKYTLLAEDVRFSIEGNTLVVEPRPLARSRLIAEVLKDKETPHDNTNPKAASGQ